VRLVADNTCRRVARVQLQPKLTSTADVERLVEGQIEQEEQANHEEAMRARARQRKDELEAERLEMQIMLAEAYADDPSFQALSEHGKLRMLEQSATRIFAQKAADAWEARRSTAPVDCGPGCLTPGCSAHRYILQANGYCVVCNTQQKLGGS